MREGYQNEDRATKPVMHSPRDMNIKNVENDAAQYHKVSGILRQSTAPPPKKNRLRHPESCRILHLPRKIMTCRKIANVYKTMPRAVQICSKHRPSSPNTTPATKNYKNDFRNHLISSQAWKRFRIACKIQRLPRTQMEKLRKSCKKMLPESFMPRKSYIAPKPDIARRWKHTFAAEVSTNTFCQDFLRKRRMYRGTFAL